MTEHLPRKPHYEGSDITVVIPTYNNEQTIAPLLESLLEQTTLPREILVVDDCSKDFTKEITLKYPHPVRFVQREKNGGAAAARNTGIAEAKGEIVLFLDSDTRCPKDLVDQVLFGFNTHPEIVAQAGCCSDTPLNKGWFPLYKCLSESALTDVPQWDAKVKLINARIGAYITETLRKTGGFDEKYPGASVEDHEYGIRYTKEYPIHANPRLKVDHHFSNFLETVKNYYNRAYQTMALFKTHGNVTGTGGLSLLSALQYVTGPPLLLLIPLACFYPALWWVVLLCLAAFLAVSEKVVRKLFSKGIFFGCFGICVHLLYGVVVLFAAVRFNLDALRGEKGI